MSIRRIWTVLALMALWFVAKTVTAWAFVFRTSEYSDTYYFWMEYDKYVDVGTLAQVLPEYPTPAAWLLMVVGQVSPDDGWGWYRISFVLFLVLIDAVFTMVLIARTSPVGVIGWFAFTTTAGHLTLLRLDLLPAALAATGVLLVLLGRPTRAGPLVALGAAVKLWPAVLVPFLLSRRGHWKRPMLAFSVTGLVAVAVSVALAGWTRLLTPLTWQSGRGLQIEAIAATPAMVWRLFDGQHFVQLSLFNAYEVFGPRVSVLISATTVASVVVLGVFIGLVVVWWRRGRPLESIPPLAIFAVVAFIATSKAFSPQYLLWSGAIATVWFGLAWGHDSGFARGPATVAFGWSLLLMVLTTAIYPWNYQDLLYGRGIATALLVIRNVVLVTFALWLATAALIRPQDEQSPDVQEAA